MAERVLDCPNCGKAGKLYVNTGTFAGYCFSCQSRYGPSQGRRLLDGKSAAPTAYRAGLRPPPKLMNAWLHPDARKYLSDPIPAGRGLVEADAPDIMYSEREQELYFSVWSPSPEFAPSWHRRGITEGGFWKSHPGTHRNHYVYGKILGRRVVVVEGIIDAIRIGSGAISILGSKVSDTHQVFFRGFEQVMWWGDPDFAGDHLNTEGVMKIPGSGIIQYEKEPGNCRRDDPKILEVRAWLRQ